jgi:hypothetical protein
MRIVFGDVKIVGLYADSISLIIFLAVIFYNEFKAILNTNGLLVDIGKGVL